MYELLNRARELQAQFEKYPWVNCLIKTMVRFDLDYTDPNFMEQLIKITMDEHMDIYLELSLDQANHEIVMFEELARNKDNLKLFNILFRV